MTINYAQFRESLSEKMPQEEFSAYLKALWFDAKGDWERAHVIIQDIDDHSASWIHAYLHRKEGDTGNADYWYRRAGKKRPEMTLEKEWETIVNEFIHH